MSIFLELGRLGGLGGSREKEKKREKEKAKGKKRERKRRKRKGGKQGITTISLSKDVDLQKEALDILGSELLPRGRGESREGRLE